MVLRRFNATRYRSLSSVSVELGQLNVFVGANAAGKSNLLDCLRFLQEGLQEGDFVSPVYRRGGLIHLAWKGDDTNDVRLVTFFEDGDERWRWTVRLKHYERDFGVEESLEDKAGKLYLESHEGKGYWLSQDGRQVPLRQEYAACALSAAARDASFLPRTVADFVNGWACYDPSPALLRRATLPEDYGDRLDPQGKNLAGRLYELWRSDEELFNEIVEAAQSLLGLPQKIEFQEIDGRVYFKQAEPGLKYRVHQVGASSGTLRILALLTALVGGETTLIGIEEPENHVHPLALEGFVEYMRRAAQHRQVLVTTHSPILLNYLNEPDAVMVVKRDSSGGTQVEAERHPEAVRVALDQSGFGLGDFYQTTGFGAP